MILKQFHPAISSWFKNHFAEPTTCQQAAWPAILDGRDTLIAAPTGSGKTLAAFLAAIDQMVRRGIEQGLEDQTHILYISPLKALSNDIQRNLEQPLEGISTELLGHGHPDIIIQAKVRTGDTPTSERTAMAKRPPHILVTTPESLYLLLTSDSGRRMLKTVKTVIVDEIHALVHSKRGSHLTLSLERLAHLCEKKPTRIGLSATQRPIELVARFLIGNAAKLSDCVITDSGHRRAIDLAIETPSSPLESLLSGQAAGEIYDKISQLINTHRTTLVFVNTRRMAERVAHALSERVDSDAITSHHGSLAKEQRLSAETKLKTGQLRALVATTSLELGIDIGEIDLVCQIGTTGSISTLLQRVGRSGHSLRGKPKGRLFPTTRDELLECIALLRVIKRGELDRSRLPLKPLDVLAQQITAMVACEEWNEEALFDCVRNATPYHTLDKKEFGNVIKLLSEGYSTQRGRRSAYLHRDSINKHLAPRRGARLTAITCGGAIPDNAEYRVILEPGGEFIGTVDEDFAMESLSGDIFQLGNTSWRVLRLDGSNLRVEDAQNQPPSIPFWFGEVPGRSDEVSLAFSQLREHIADQFNTDNNGYLQAAKSLLSEINMDVSAAQQAVNYVGAAKIALSEIPTLDRLVLERFFDESGGMQLILHSAFGSRINRAWGLALRKRFCRTFNFELQAAATENAIILSLGTSQSFDLAEVAHYLHSASIRDILIQALLDAPMFTIRWRWNCTCALAIKRFQGGKKTPPYLVRMQSEDLISSVFPDQLACQENLNGDREIPEHPLIEQTINDCLTDAMDIGGLITVLKRIESGDISIIARDVVEPSPFSAEILSARNYAFLDGAPAEERRTRAVISRRWLDPNQASDLAQLDPAAIDRVRDEIRPKVDNRHELYDALMVLGSLDDKTQATRKWKPWFDELVAQGRATLVCPKGLDRQFWVCADRLPMIRTIYSEASINPELNIIENATLQTWDRESALIELVRARLDNVGPIDIKQLSDILAINAGAVEKALLSLETEGFALRGNFTPGQQQIEWCERGLLTRIHRYTIKKLRQAVKPVSTQDYFRFLFAWQHLSQGRKMRGADALDHIISQLEGFEASAGAWEADILPSRIDSYNPNWMDGHCSSGKTIWFRASKPNTGAAPIKSTPITLFSRKSLSQWRILSQPPNTVELSGIATKVSHALQIEGASFFEELLDQTGLLESQLESALAELVSRGLLSADSFSGLRALLVPEHKRRSKLKPLFRLNDAGRWTLVYKTNSDIEPAEIAPEAKHLATEHFTRLLLSRYGVIFNGLLARETLSPTWGDLLPILRRMEARGDLRGGRFVANQYGEQFGRPEAIQLLRKLGKEPEQKEHIVISAVDPLNLIGIITPGKKVNSIVGNRILFQNGLAVAILTGKEVQFLHPIEEPLQWEIKQRLIQRGTLSERRNFMHE